MILQREAPTETTGVVPSGGVAQLGLLLGLAAMLTSLVGGRLTRTEDVDGYGILFALPPLYWLSIILAMLGSGLLLLASMTGNRRLATVVPGVWLVVAHASPAVAHDYARFSIAYIHLGFIRLIDAERAGDILIDARFAWPGFFGSFIASLSRMDPAIVDWVMRLWPTLIMAASAALVAALARRSYPNRPLIGPLSSLVFILLSWTGQDYFSPQSIGFLFYLSIIIVLESGPLRPRGAWSSFAPILSRFATAGGDRPEARSTASFVALLILAFGAIVSHPLAPFFICAALAMLGIYGRTVAWRLLVLVAVGYVLWVLVAAEPWWSTRIDELTDQIGSLFTNFGDSTSGRVARSSSSHLLVTTTRTIIGLATFLSTLVLGIVMATERFRYLRPTLPLAPLAGIPVLAAALQSYGGEIIIRVLLFTLPMASILLARLLLALPRLAIPVVVPVLAALVMPVFLVARFGNESFEMVTSADRDAVLAAYAETDENTVLIADNAFLPWGDEQRDTVSHRYRTASATPEWIDVIKTATIERGGDRAIVVLTPSQSALLEHVESRPPNDLDRIGEWLSGQPGVETIFSEGGAWVLIVPT